MDTIQIHPSKSLNNLSTPENVAFPNSAFLSHSLPNVNFDKDVAQNKGSLIVAHSSTGEEVIKKNHHKIFKKTWDKVKTVIIHSTSSNAYRRGSAANHHNHKAEQPPPGSKGMVLQNNSNINSYASSAPSTPLHKQTFDFDRQFSTKEVTGKTLSTTFSDTELRSSGSNDSSAEGADATTMKSTTANEEVKEADPDFEKIKRNYAILQKRLSEELHERMNEHKPDHKNVTETLSEDFRRRLRQWEMWKVSTGKVTYTDEELEQILPQEFTKKLHEWETIKTSAKEHNSSTSPLPRASTSSTTPSDNLLRQDANKSKLLRKKKNVSEKDKEKEKSDCARQKELAWLEKQLEKVDGEKKRLERELKKYVEREARLEKMKEALQNVSESEVWIQTPTAKCRVEKVTEKFTKKLYEWEEKQGILPESSTMALLNPKYYGSPPSADEDVVVVAAADTERRVQAEFNATRYDDDTPAVSSCRDSESRQDDCERDLECDEDETCCEYAKEDTLRAVEEVPFSHKDSYSDGHQEDHRASSASSSDLDEEATDSMATHDKGNSGASNTDSDFYRADFLHSRRRSSEPISTPLSARSPSLSAFTSDDEDGDSRLLKTVSEENETVTNLKDAESQTEVILKAKPVVVDEDRSDDEAVTDEAGVFVPTKRTIFTPFLDNADTEKVVVIEEQDLKSPSLIRNLLHHHQENGMVPTLDLSPPPTPSTSTSCPRMFLDDIFPSFSSCTTNAYTLSPRPGRNSPVSNFSMRMTLPRPPPPRIVEVTPKVQPTSTTSLCLSSSPSNPPQMNTQRNVPKMGKIPVWCSPLTKRRQIGPTVSTQQSISMDLTAEQLLPQTSLEGESTSVLCTTDTNLTENPTTDSPFSTPCGSVPLGPGTGRRNTSASVPEESGIVGAGIRTGQRHPAFPARSSSFRIQRTSSSTHTSNATTSHPPSSPTSDRNKGLYHHLKKRMGSVITKSQSTGSIRSKLGKAISSISHKMAVKEQPHPHSHPPHHHPRVPSVRSQPSELPQSPNAVITTAPITIIPNLQISSPPIVGGDAIITNNNDTQSCQSSSTQSLAKCEDEETTAIQTGCDNCR